MALAIMAFVTTPPWPDVRWARSQIVCFYLSWVRSLIAQNYQLMASEADGKRLDIKRVPELDGFRSQPFVTVINPILGPKSQMLQ